MNRRNFIWNIAIGGISLPLISYGNIFNSSARRSDKSLFTINELKTYCDKNGFKYVDDKDIWLKDNKWKYTTYKGKNYWLYRKFPFIHKNDTRKWYESLRYWTLDAKFNYDEVLLYDIVETTMDWQKERNEFYSMMICSVKYHKFNAVTERIERMQSIDRIYDIETNAWLRPTLLTDGWPIFDKFELL